MSVRNPLEIDVVLSNILDFLPVESLSSCRLVCKRWYDLATPIFGDKMLQQNRILELNSENWNSFLTTITASRRLYHRKLILHSVPIAEIYPKMMKNYGHLITSLTLLTYYQESVCLLTLNTFRQLISSLPYLEELVLEALPNEVSACTSPLFPTSQQQLHPLILPHLKTITLILKSLSYSQQFFFGLFSAAQNLESLIIQETNSNFHLLIVILRNLRENFRTIKSLHIAQLNEVCLQVLNSYSENGMKLKELYLENLSADVLHFTIFNLLSQQASSLEILLIGRPSACRSVFLNFAFPFFMPNLKTLDFWTHSLDWSNIMYSRQLPQLETVILRAYRSFHNWSTPLPNPEINRDSPCTSVNKIIWKDDCNGSDSCINLWKTYLLFPYVKSVVIKMCWDSKLLQSLWTFWPEIEELEIHLDAELQCVDSAFTGIPPDECIQIFRRQDLFNPYSVQTHLPSIGKLSGLKKLRIYQNYNSSSLLDIRNELTDVTGYTIKFHLLNLEELIISKRSMISQACLDQLRLLPNMKNLHVLSRLIQQ